MRFEEYHPMLLLLFFVFVLAASAVFQHPMFILISFLCSFLYSVHLKRGRALVFNVVQCLLWAAYPFVYASYHHFGVTSLDVNFIGNQITAEAFLYGASIAVRGASVVMWAECLYQVFSSDKVGYLLGRVSVRLALFLSILLRLVPQVRERFKAVCAARRGIGRGPLDGSLRMRLQGLCAILSAVTGWTMEQLIEQAKAMNSRGYTLRGKTAFSIYRFDNRDRTLVLWMAALFTVVLSGHALEQTRIVYAPQLILNPVSAVTCIFYAGYALLCLLPLLLEWCAGLRFALALRHAQASDAGEVL